MKQPLTHALALHLADDIPAWGKDEQEIDQPEWDKMDTNDPSLPGGGLARHSMLYIGEGCNRMFLVHGGKVAWTFDAGKGWEYDDVWMLQNGNILFSRMYWAAEVTPRKEFSWYWKAPEGTEIHTLQPIGPDRVMLVENARPLPKMLIIDKKTNQVLFEHEIPYADCSVHGQFRRFRVTGEGTFLAPCLSMGCVIEYDQHFRECWRYEIPSPWAAVRLTNGNTLITGEKEGVTREVDRAGNTVWEYYLSEIPEKWRPSGTQSCERLANGNIIICSRGEGHTPQLVEVTKEKEIVWVLRDWKHLGPCTAVQILTEPGEPEVPGALMR